MSKHQRGSGGGLEGLGPVLDLIPLAWLALVAYGWAMLLLLPGSPDRPLLPGVQAAEGAVAPLLSVIALAAIIKRFALRSAPGKEPPAAECEAPEGPATR